MINVPERLQIYPRGFLGRPLPTNVTEKKMPFSSVMNQKQFNWSLLDAPNNERKGDPAVDSLFSKYLRAEGNINSHNFRERIFKAALDLFAGRDFYFWFITQKASPMYGDYHQRFLEDTIKYLATGQRSLNIQAWATLLTFTQDSEKAQDDDLFVKEFFGEKIAGRGENTPCNRDIVDILQLWWSKPSGVGDLLYTLHILFGNL